MRIGTVGGAAAFALAGILSFAAVIAGLAAALAFAIVLPFAGMFCRIVEGCLRNRYFSRERFSSANGGSGGRGRWRGGFHASGSSADESGDCGGHQQLLHLLVHKVSLCLKIRFVSQPPGRTPMTDSRRLAY
jgi:hypothetical protein